MRQVVLDTETTGISHQMGHRVIEIGCLELLNRRITGEKFHYYLNPDREIDEGAQRVHGITFEFLQDKKRFKDIADDFLEFIDGAELIIHNAPFDVGFLNSELALLGGKYSDIESRASILDTLQMARKLYPGQRNSLDALCKRLNISNEHRTLHGALLDSEILAEVYLAMTSGQGTFEDGFKKFDGQNITSSTTYFSNQTLGTKESKSSENLNCSNNRIESSLIKNTQSKVSKPSHIELKVLKATDKELNKHKKRLDSIDKSSPCLWKSE